MNPEMKKIIKAIQDANPGISEEDAIKAVVNYASDNIECIIIDLKLSKKRSKIKKVRDELRLIRTKGGELRKAEIRSKKQFIDDLNEIREYLLDEGHTTEADMVSRNITQYEDSANKKQSVLMNIDSTLTKVMQKKSDEQKSATESKTLVKDLLEDLDE